MLVLAYNVGRIVTTGFNQLRDALFARVGQHAVRQLAYRTFVHLHGLSLRFHLERRTGGLSRIIERGTTGIETIVRFTILNTRADGARVRAAAAIIWYQFDCLLPRRHRRDGLALRLVHGEGVSDWRIKIRREMNEFRHGRALEGDRTRCSISRRSNISATRSSRRSASTASMARYEQRGGPNLDVARLAQHRPGGDLHRRHGDLHGDVGARRSCAASRRSAISC